MKKIFIILLLIACANYAQTITAKANKVGGQKTLWRSAGGDTVSNGVHVTGGGLSTFPGGQTYANIRNSWDWARSRTVMADTVRTDSVSVVRSRDTITISASEWSKVTVSAAAGDSISFAIGTVAPSNSYEWQTVRNGESFTSEKLNFTYFTKVFLKGAGYPDHIESYQVIIEAF